nr:TrkH family potassium uptake protein [Streptococcus oralis]
FIIIVLVSTCLITLNTLHLYQGVYKSVEMAFFQVSKIITTTGFGYGDITICPLFSKFIILFLIRIVRSAGSTAGV